MVFRSPEYLDALDDVSDMGIEPAGLVFSGGGNDILGADENNVPVFHKLLHRDLPDPNIDNVFRQDQVAAQFDFIRRAYTSLISHVHADYPDVPIFIHGYDYVYPGNFDSSDHRAPFYAAKDQWIGKPMDDLGIRDKQLQKEIVANLLDQFRGMQESLADAHENVFLVDTLGTLDDISLWNDEIHPNNAGYARIYQKFLTKISEVVAP
jgi:lysophospholipase L1-like esterase